MTKSEKKIEFGFEGPEFEIIETKEDIGFEDLKKIVLSYQERLKNLSEISEFTDFFFKEKLEYKKELLTWKDQTMKNTLVALDKAGEVLSKMNDTDWNKGNLEKFLIEGAEKFGREVIGKIVDRGYLLWPLRVALTGKKASASPFEVAEILGKEKTLKRIEVAKKIIANN